MRCPECGNKRSHVEQTRPTDTINWRLRRCDKCGHTWLTSEMVDEPPAGTFKSRMQAHAARI